MQGVWGPGSNFVTSHVTSDKLLVYFGSYSSFGKTRLFLEMWWQGSRSLDPALPPPLTGSRIHMRAHTPTHYTGSQRHPTVFHLTSQFWRMCSQKLQIRRSSPFCARVRGGQCLSEMLKKPPVLSQELYQCGPRLWARGGPSTSSQIPPLRGCALHDFGIEVSTLRLSERSL